MTLEPPEASQGVDEDQFWGLFIVLKTPVTVDAAMGLFNRRPSLTTYWSESIGSSR